MEVFLKSFTEFIKMLNTYIWGPFGIIALLCGTGLFFTIILKGIQFRNFFAGWKQLLGNFSFSGKAADRDGMSSFQAATTAVAAQVGTGSLVGAVTALTSGGPGAIFWIWFAALLGMATMFAEACLAQVFKSKDETGYTVGGAAYCISKGLKKYSFSKPLSIFFACAIIIGVEFVNMAQANSISDAFDNAFSIPNWVTGIVVAFMVAFVVIGGIKRIASLTEKLVPFMAITYILIGGIILVLHIRLLPQMIITIFKSAFTARATWGGTVGFTMGQAARYGIARGLFSNEAGMGSAPHAHAVAKVDHPVKQGLIASISVFITTFIVLTMTVFVVFSQNLGEMPSGKGIEIVQHAFGQTLFGEVFGYSFIAFALFLFAFSTIIGYYYFGETNIRFLFGKKGIVPYKVVIVLFVFLGSILNLDLVWELTDFFNALMIIPNLISILLLSGIVVRLVNEYNQGIPFNVNHYVKN